MGQVTYNLDRVSREGSTKPKAPPDSVDYIIATNRIQMSPSKLIKCHNWSMSKSKVTIFIPTYNRQY
jgi:hypothetical protein